MKKWFSVACVLSVAASSAMVVYAYRNDGKVHEAIDNAKQSVNDFITLIKEQKINRKAQSSMKNNEQILQNQDWADQQWEALGI